MNSTNKAAAIILCLVLLVLIFMVYSRGETPLRPVCVTPEERIIIRAGVLAAIEDGLKDHMKILFVGWIKDPTHQPERASAGIQAAVVAYQRARADALRWDPKIC